MPGLPPREHARHDEAHRSHRAGWLRAAVLGANDGIVSTASLLVGVAAAGAGRSAIITAGLAGLVAGAMAMAAGEYVSVSSQRDTERGDLAREARELASQPEAELAELAGIYRQRGLSPDTARQVAIELTEHDALAAHARDELGLTELNAARPVQAGAYSAVSFTLGALPPLLAVFLTPAALRIPVLIVVALACLAGSGGLGAKAGGASVWRGAARVTLGGGLAMAATAVIGALVGTTGL